MREGHPYEVELGHAAVVLARLLEREMDTVFRDLIGELANASDLLRRRAVTANRIVLLCRNLQDEVRCYEHLRAIDDEPDDNPGNCPGDDQDDPDELPF